MLNKQRLSARRELTLKFIVRWCRYRPLVPNSRSIPHTLHLYHRRCWKNGECCAQVACNSFYCRTSRLTIGLVCLLPLTITNATTTSSLSTLCVTMCVWMSLSLPGQTHLNLSISCVYTYSPSLSVSLFYCTFTPHTFNTVLSWNPSTISFMLVVLLLPVS